MHVALEPEAKVHCPFAHMSGRLLVPPSVQPRRPQLAVVEVPQPHADAPNDIVRAVAPENEGRPHEHVGLATTGAIASIFIKIQMEGLGYLLFYIS